MKLGSDRFSTVRTGNFSVLILTGFFYQVIAQKEAEAEQRRKRKMFTLKDAVRDRGVMVGASMYHEILITQRVDIDFLDWGGGGLGRYPTPFLHT